jgi:Spondin_N
VKLSIAPPLVLMLSMTAITAQAQDSATTSDSNDSSAQHAGRSRIVRITCENLTSGQVFSPGVFFSHNTSAPPLFLEGVRASFELQRIAEEGNTAPLLSGRITRKFGGAYGSAVPTLSIQPERAQTVLFKVDSEHPLITGAFMLFHTNDGFAGIHDVDAFNTDETQTIDLFAYDAGTENNNELGEFLPAMKGIERDPENGVVRQHEGLRGDADAPGAWKFDPARPVARITISPLW